MPGFTTPDHRSKKSILLCLLGSFPPSVLAVATKGTTNIKQAHLPTLLPVASSLAWPVTSSRLWLRNNDRDQCSPLGTWKHSDLVVGVNAYLENELLPKKPRKLRGKQEGKVSVIELSGEYAQGNMPCGGKY